MANPASVCCRNAGDLPRHETKIETSEYFNPDILHVLMDDAGNDTPSIFPKSLGKTHPRGSPSSFPQFQYLPTELRCLIWGAAVPEATVVPRTWGKFKYNLQRNVPAVLQVCSESRRHLISQSERSRRSTTPKYQLVRTCRGGDESVYINWQADSIWIYRGCEFLVATLGRPVTDNAADDINEAEVAAYAGLESLVMNWGLRPCWVESTLGQGVRFIQQFPRLRLLTLLLDFSEHGWPESLTLKGLKRLKRNEVKRIWALVQRSFKEAHELDPQWSPPSLHIVHRTANWSRQEVRRGPVGRGG